MKILISHSTKFITNDKATTKKWNVDKILAYGTDIKNDLIELPFNESDSDVTILIPTILDSVNALAYDGANFALRILFKTIRKRNKGINIVLMGCETAESFLRHYPYPNIMKIPGVSYSLFNYGVISSLNLPPCPINRREGYKDSLINLGLKLPTSFKSTHSLTNEWSLYKWNSFMDFYSQEDEGRLNFLYFDYIRAIEKINNVKTRYIKNIETLQQSYKSLLGKERKILLIDDNPLWHEFFKNFFANSKIIYKAIGTDFKKKTADEILEIVRTEMENFTPDVILLDFRLLEDSDANETSDNISGTLVLKDLKGTFDNPGMAYGRQIIMFTATSRIENIMLLQNANADGFILKEKTESYQSKEITIDAISKMISTLDNAIERADFLIPLNEKLNKLSDLLTQHYNQDSELKLAVNIITQSVRQVTQKNNLTEDILKLVYLNIFKIFEEIKKCPNLVEYPNDYSLIIHTKSKLNVCSHGKSFISKKRADDWNCIRIYNKDSWHEKFCKEQDLNFAICALILFRLGFNQVDETKWNDIRIIRNCLVHGPNKQLAERNLDLSLPTLKRYSLKMLDLLCAILDPSNIREVSLIEPN